jgi:hypothetical protein
VNSGQLPYYTRRTFICNFQRFQTCNGPQSIEAADLENTWWHCDTFQASPLNINGANKKSPFHFAEAGAASGGGVKSAVPWGETSIQGGIYTLRTCLPILAINLL